MLAAATAAIAANPPLIGWSSWNTYGFQINDSVIKAQADAIDSQERAWHTVHSNWIYNLGNGNNPKSSYNEPTPLDRYHIYSLEWDETSLVWYVDGRQVA